jgi:DNA repair exonuclease SbcCD ATPase subunit
MGLVFFIYYRCRDSHSWRFSNGHTRHILFHTARRGGAAQYADADRDTEDANDLNRGRRKGIEECVSKSNYMSSASRPRSSAGASKAAAPAAAKSDAAVAPVEKEYIHNLQQQVYILECEAKYLRTKEQTAGPGPDAATLAANSFMGPPEDVTANTNLGDMAKDLKSRCAEVESKYQQQVRKANQAAAEYEQKKQYLKLNQQQLELERDTALRQIEELFVFVAKQKDAISSQMYTLSDKERELNKQLQTLELELQEMISAKHDALMRTSQVENSIRDCSIDLEQLQKETSNNQSGIVELRSSAAAKKEQVQQMKKKLQELMGCMNGQEESEFLNAIQMAEQEIQQLQLREQQIKAQIESEERKHESFSKEFAQAQLKKFEAQQVGLRMHCCFVFVIYFDAGPQEGGDATC